MSAKKQPHVCITGVSRGLGLHLLDRFLQAGCRVSGISRQITPDLQIRIEQNPAQLQHYSVDLAVENLGQNVSIRQIFAPAEPCDALILNAAQAREALATDFESAPVKKLFQLNVFSSMELGRLFLRNRLAHGGNGSLVFISSVCAHTGYSGLSTYAASKAAMEAWVRTVSREWGRKQIRANSIAAGFMETEMSASLDDAQRQRIFRRTPLGRATDPASVAATAYNLTTEDSSSVTGETIRVE